MRDGHLLQVDTPQTLYEQPKDLFVAGFIGSPAMNLVEARIDGEEVVLGQYRVPLAADRRPGVAGDVILGIRPETFEDAAFASSELPTIETDVVVVEELGSDAHVFFRVDASRVAAGLEDEADPPPRPPPPHDRPRGEPNPARTRPLAVPLLRRRDRYVAARTRPHRPQRAGCLGRALSRAALVLTSTNGRLRCSA
jgi:multiple sugar transport system ATP-binding protein